SRIALYRFDAAWPEGVKGRLRLWECSKTSLAHMLDAENEDAFVDDAIQQHVSAGAERNDQLAPVGGASFCRSSALRKCFQLIRRLEDREQGTTRCVGALAAKEALQFVGVEDRFLGPDDTRHGQV